MGARLDQPEDQQPNAELKVRKPSQSGRLASGSRDSSTLRSMSVIVMTLMGTLTKKIQCHLAAQLLPLLQHTRRGANLN